MTTDAAAIIKVHDKIAYTMKQVREIEWDLDHDRKFLAELRKGKFRNGMPMDKDFLNHNLPRMELELAKHTEILAKLNEKLTPMLAQRVRVGDLPFHEILNYFQGSGLEAARCGLELLQACIAEDRWLPGASRRCRSVLNLAKASKKLLKNPKALATFRSLLGEIETITSKWDSIRPKPTFTKLGASPTVTATLNDLKAIDVDVCPIEFKLVEDKNGARYVGFLIWPEGILHHTSKYSYTDSNQQCQACGHAIKNATNWLPLILSSSDGKKRSLWVGRDCAKTLFGINMGGELEIEGR